MKRASLEARLTHKNRLCWLLPLFWAIIYGTAFYLFVPSYNFVTFLIVSCLFTIIYTTICEIATKSLQFFLRNSIFVYSLASVVFYILNYVSPKHVYSSDDPYGFKVVVGLYIFFLMFFAAIASVGTLLARLVSGYEALCEKPCAVSYLIKGKGIDKKIHSLLTDFLSSMNITPTIVASRTQTYTKFFDGTNQYFLFYNSLDNNSVEVNFIILGWEKDTIVEPNKDDLDIFLRYFESFLDIQVQKERITEWTSNFNPQNEEVVKAYIWKYYTSPLQIKETIMKKIVARRIINLLKSHKKEIFSLILGILITIISQLIIRMLGI